MKLENLKDEFIKLKKEEFEYLYEVLKVCNKRKLREEERIDMYRRLHDYYSRLKNIISDIKNHLSEKKVEYSSDDIILEFDIDSNYLSDIYFETYPEKKKFFSLIGIDLDTYKCKLTYSYLTYYYHQIHPDDLLRHQPFFDKPIYVLLGEYADGFGEFREKAYEYCKNFRHGSEYVVEKSKKDAFEKKNIIIPTNKYVRDFEIEKIFKEELLNTDNKTFDDCISKTRERIDIITNERSPEYRKKLFFEKINNLYSEVKGELISEENLFDGEFLSIINEKYKLPNNKIVTKEKVNKNKGKDSVIIIPVTDDGRGYDTQYIITFQNRINDKMIAEFPAGYIEDGEDPLEAAKRELAEETGYVAEDLLLIDQVFTSPGIDNSTTYIVIAYNCLRQEEEKVDGTEFVKYCLITKKELQYLIEEKIISGAINKLAYYIIKYDYYISHGMAGYGNSGKILVYHR